MAGVRNRKEIVGKNAAETHQRKMAAELSKTNSQITTLNECADSVSVSHHGPSSMHQAVILFLGRGRDTSYISVCSGSLYGRPPPPAVQVNCQHDLWRRELSLDGLLNLPLTNWYHRPM